MNNKYNNVDHDQVIITAADVKYIKNGMDRIENKIDNWPGICNAKHIGVDKRIDRKMSWSHFAIFLSAIGIVIAVIKWVPAIAALL